MSFLDPTTDPRLHAIAHDYLRERLSLTEALTYLSAHPSAPQSQPEAILILAILCNHFGHVAKTKTLCQQMMAACESPECASLLYRVWLELAIAHNQLGDLQLAREALQCAHERHDPSNLAQLAHLTWVEGQTSLYGNQYETAREQLEVAYQQLVGVGLPLAATRCQLWLGQAWLHTDLQQAQRLLMQVQSDLNDLGTVWDQAAHRYTTALVYQYLHHYSDALSLHQACIHFYLEHDATFLCALSQAEVGVLFWRLNRYPEAEQLLQTARQHFIDNQAMSEATRCEINLGLLYKEMGRLPEAVGLWQNAATQAEQSGRWVRVARCYDNLSAAFQLLGQYERALTLCLRARALFDERYLHAEVNECDRVLALIYQQLGLHAEAAKHYQQTRQYYLQHQFTPQLARCDIQFAELHLLQKEGLQAIPLLHEARAIGEAHNLPLHVAECDRLLAVAAGQQKQWAMADAHLQQAYAVFAAEKLDVYLARCDLVAGELYLAAAACAQATAAFDRALRVFKELIPAEASRALEGLGRCALYHGAPTEALEYFLQSLTVLHTLRSLFVSERLSAAYFEHQRELLTLALPLAVGQRRLIEALGICEAAKASAFTTYLQQRQRRDENATDPDAYTQSLRQRALRLRERITKLSAQIDLAAAPAMTPLPQSHTAWATDWREQTAAYEVVLEQLRLAESSMTTQRSSAPNLFATAVAHPLHMDSLLAQMRVRLSSSYGTHWLCLVYQYLEDTLYIFAITPQAVECHSQRLPKSTQALLKQCAAPARAVRERIYRGTVRGRPVGSTSSQELMRQLSAVLLPPPVQTMVHELECLYIVPSGILHGIPFQALLCADTHLIEHASVIYAPSLRALTLFNDPSPTATASISDEPPGELSTSPALFCGLSDYRGGASALPYAETEVKTLARLWGSAAQPLCGASATPSALQRLNADGLLAQYRILHFATHCVLDARAPLQAHLVLSGGALTAADILNWRLERALVTLSACQSADGVLQRGDELVNLARIFFYAGAQTLVASLWPVEDQPTQQLMMLFYQAIRRGTSVAQAMQQAQIALLRQGLSPYQWAAFNVLGKG